MTILSIKVDVDTERGTRIGVPSLVSVLKEHAIPATFLFSLGPDNTGRAIQRVFRRGFLKKVSRTSVVQIYGIRTLMNGVLLPGPQIGKKHAKLLQNVSEQGFEVGIHAYDHQRWQDGVQKMTQPEIEAEFARARAEFQRIFGVACKTAGAPGWQVNAKTLAVYDLAALDYASDCRGSYPFFPKVDGTVFNTLQIPTTLPTLDELAGRPEFPMEKLAAHYLSLLREDVPNIITIHAELEGMHYLTWFKEFLQVLLAYGVKFEKLDTIAQRYLAGREKIPVCELIQAEVDGRSGLLGVQKA